MKIGVFDQNKTPTPHPPLLPPFPPQAANLVAFACIPADLRIIYGNAIGVLWVTFVSLSCAAPGAGPPPPPLDKLE